MRSEAIKGSRERGSKGRRSRGDALGGGALDRFDLYELCVQSPRHVVALLRAIHGGPRTGARVLGEDFAGTAAVSRQWVRTVNGGRAIAVDHDGTPLQRARPERRIKRIVGDVMTVNDPADVVFVGNFSIGEWHQRADLLQYLRHVRRRLARSAGVFVCDTYGGASAFVEGHVHRYHDVRAAGGKGPARRVRYTWEQRRADPLTGLVEDALHFRVECAGEIESQLHDAFVYRWRLWSVPELRDALAEAGFARTEVYSQLPDAVDTDGIMYARPVEDAGELGESFIVCVAARVA